MYKPKVAFVCVHNSCRSQMAEALSKLLAEDVFEAYSAGTALKANINSDAVKTMNDLYGINIKRTQHPKTLEAIPEVDIVVTMGCNVECPYLPCKHREDWGLEDPTEKGEEAFKETAKIIEQRVIDLKERIENKIIPL